MLGIRTIESVYFTFSQNVTLLLFRPYPLQWHRKQCWSMRYNAPLNSAIHTGASFKDTVSMAPSHSIRSALFPCKLLKAASTVRGDKCSTAPSTPQQQHTSSSSNALGSPTLQSPG